MIPERIVDTLRPTLQFFPYLVLTGSRLTPYATEDSDWDFLAYHDETDRAGQYLEQLGFTRNAASSWRKDDINLLVMSKTDFDLHVQATRILQALQLEHKWQRKLLFRMICEGPQFTGGVPAINVSIGSENLKLVVQ